MRIAIVLVVTAACSKGAAPAASGSAGSGSSGSAIAQAAPAPTPVAIDAGPPPLSPKIKAARCSEPCLFLVDTPLGKLVDTYQAECGGMKTQELGFDDCKQLDYVRNCIYAAHGVVYKKQRWKMRFESKPWYEPNPAVDPKAVLGDIELANVHELHERGKACKKGLEISGADYERLNKWFAALPQPPLPKVAFFDGEPIDAKHFYARLQDRFGARKITLGGKNTAMYMGDQLHYTGADYPADDMPSAMVTAIHAPDEKKLRAIRVQLPVEQAPGEDFIGTHIFFIYDDKDELRGVEARPFVYEACVGNGDCD